MSDDTSRAAAIRAFGKLCGSIAAFTLAGLPVPMLLGLRGMPPPSWSVALQAFALIVFAAGSLILVRYRPDTWDGATPGERLAYAVPNWCYYAGCFAMSIYIAWSNGLGLH